jgi:hypothetical protein
MYDDTPVMARILAPSMNFYDADFEMFPREMEEGGIEFKEEAQE